MRNLILVFNLFIYFYTVKCVFFASNTSDPVLRQLKALEHVHTFLVEVQQEIKESRDLLKHIKNGVSLETTEAVRKISPGKTLARDPWRYLSKTPPQRLLRTNSGNKSSGSTSANPTTTSVAEVPGVQQQTKMSFLQVHDVFPDLSPHYRDIFAPDPERQGISESYLIPNTGSSSKIENDMIPTVTTYRPASGVPQNTDDLQKLFTHTTKAFSAGDILQGLFIQTTTPDAHPQLHKQLVRDSTGYFSVGVENLLMLIVTKDPEHVKAVLEPTAVVINNLEVNDIRANLHWLEHPMSDVLHTIAALLAPGVTDIGVTRARANLLWTLLKNRHSMLGEEVNQILDFADGMVKEEDGERIFDRLDDFLHFPNVTTKLLRPQYKTGRDLCEALIKAFNYPFSDKTVDRQRLANSANAALVDHFGEMSLGHRRIGFSDWLSKIDSWLTRLGSKFTTTLFRSRASRISTHRRNTRQRAVHRLKKGTRISSHSIYHRAQPFGKFENSNFLKQQSNTNKPLVYTFRSTKKRFSKRFHNETKKLTPKPMLLRSSVSQRAMENLEETEDKSYKKNNKRRIKRVTKNQESDQIYDKKSHVFNKWISSHTESNDLHRRFTNFPIQNYTTQRKEYEGYHKQLKSSQSNIKFAVTLSKLGLNEKTNTDTAETQSEDTMDIDNSKSSSRSDDEKEILDVNLLNRLLNVTAEENSENDKPLNISIETDDDVEILKHLKDVFYDK